MAMLSRGEMGRVFRNDIPGGAGDIVSEYDEVR
jgi:hypothetical protein